MNDFSALSRPKHLQKLTSKEWDVLVIGGGITGAGIALDAAARGLAVALVEKRDFAWGTSSRSTKLIHGGLRYLKQFEIGLVREVGQERAIVHRNARHIVRPEPMLLPIYQGGAVGRFTGAIGLWFYDFLADVAKSEKRKMLSAAETLDHEPLLRKEGLLGAGLYYEYRTDDARLTIDVLKTAAVHGALSLNYCRVTSLNVNEGRINGATCVDELTGKELPIRARNVINATGPWADKVRSLDPARGMAKSLLLTKGVHLVVDRTRFPLAQSVYFDVHSDNRMVFCIPRDNTVYMGTTDTVHDRSADDIPVSLDDVTYILDAVNYMFPTSELQPADVISTWAGLRPLIYEEGKAPSELSRRDEIYTDASGLITIAGGKLTGYRKMAEKIIDQIAPGTSSSTQDLPLVGCSFSSETKRREFLARLLKEQPYGEQTKRLFLRYGAETKTILSNQSNLLVGEVKYAIHHEMTQTPADFISQRTAAAYFERQWIADHFDEIIDVFAETLDWDASKISTARQQCVQVLSETASASALA